MYFTFGSGGCGTSISPYYIPQSQIVNKFEIDFGQAIQMTFAMMPDTIMKQRLM